MLIMGLNGIGVATVIYGPVVNPANGHSYYLLSQNNWIDSEAEAVSLGGHLATIRTDDENSWSNSVYVRYGATGKWQLISTSKPRWITTGKLAKTAQAADSPDDSTISDDGERNGAEIVD